MPTDTADSGADLSMQVPFEAQLGVALVALVYGVATLFDIIGDQLPAFLSFAVAAGLIGYAVHQIRQS